MAKTTRRQRKTTGRVMHEFRHGELKSGRGGKVKSRRQAVAIALHEAGASNTQSRKQKRKARTKTARKEARGQTAQQEREGKSSIGARGRTSKRKTKASRKATKRKATRKTAKRKRKTTRR